MYLVDDVDFSSCDVGHEVGFFSQVADVVYSGVASGVDFDDVY